MPTPAIAAINPKKVLPEISINTPIAAIAPPPYKQNVSNPLNLHLESAPCFSESTSALNFKTNSASFFPSVVLS